MDTPGDLLRQARLQHKLTYTQISQKTKIPLKTIKALEKNHYSKLPSPTYIKGFIHNYAQALNLDHQKIIAVFNRHYTKHRSAKILPKNLSQPVAGSWLTNVKTRNFFGLFLIVIILLTYLTLTIIKLYQPPKLTVSQPQNGQTLTNPVVIKGKTNHDTSLTLNQRPVSLRPDGSFTTVFTGDPGTHQLIFTATSRRDKVTQITRHIIITQ